MDNNEKVEKFQEHIGYKFNDPSLLQEALTTKKYGNSHRGVTSFEGLDIVGNIDTVKSVIVNRIIKKNTREVLSEALEAFFL